MKGTSLIIRILIPLALGLFAWAGIMDYSNSLSGHHLSGWDPILYACLLSIYTAMFTVSMKPEAKGLVLGSWRNIKYRAEHALRWSAAFFGGVIIFGVNSEIKAVEILHLAFTALAIIVGYTLVLLIPGSRPYRIFWRWVLLGFGFVAFFAGFWFDLYSVTWAELLVALPIAFAVYKLIQKN